MPLDSQGFINEWKGKQLDGTQAGLLCLQPELNMPNFTSHCRVCPGWYNGPGPLAHA